MATVTTLQNMPTTATFYVAIGKLDDTKLILQDSSVSQDGRQLRSTYVYVDGSPAYHTTVTWTINIDPKAKVIRHSVRLSTIETVTIDDVVSTEEPIEVVIAFNTPGASIADPTKVLRMIGTAYGLVFDTVDGSNIPDEQIIDPVAFKLTSNLYS